jgi:hypothetical protein
MNYTKTTNKKQTIISMISDTVIVTANDLMNYGKIILIENNGFQRYQFVNIYYSFNSKHFKNGNRLLNIVDGKNAFTLISSEALKNIISSSWGMPSLPFPPNVPINQITAEGEDVYIQYAGGNTDYTEGDIIFYYTAILL